MSATPSLIAFLGILVICVSAGAFFWMRRKLTQISKELLVLAKQSGELIQIQPQSAIFRGADRDFGNVKGNGVILLTDKRILFKKLTGQEMFLERGHITRVASDDNFKGETSLAAGGRHLIVTTKDGNRIGFLVKHVDNWTTVT